MVSKKFSIGTTLSLFITLVLFSNISWAQNNSELGNLVFEPVLLALTSDSPVELGGLSTGENQTLLDSINQYQTSIDELKQSSGSNSELIEQMGLLGVAYQALERHEEAIEILEEAISLVIEEGGRDNLEQIPLQEQMIPSYLAFRDIDTIDEIEELIYSLKENSYSPASQEMYFAMVNLADWNTSAYFKENYGPEGRGLQRQQGVIGKVRRSIGQTGGTGNAQDEASRGSSDTLDAIFNGTIKDVSNQDINDVRLRKIGSLYEEYQEAMSDSGNVQVEIVLDVAKRIARLAYNTKQEMNFERDNNVYISSYEGSREQALRNSPERMDESYDSGKVALDYILSIMGSVEGVPQEILASAYLDMGDWHLAYGKVNAARESYGEARTALLDAGFTSDNIDIALATDVPMKIPLFATHLYTKSSVGVSANTELSYSGYVDISYTVNELGNATGLQFINSSSEDPDRLERLIELQFKSMKFRPVLKGGELVSSGQVDLRYYYSY